MLAPYKARDVTKHISPRITSCEGIVIAVSYEGNRGGKRETYREPSGADQCERWDRCGEHHERAQTHDISKTVLGIAKLTEDNAIRGMERKYKRDEVRYSCSENGRLTRRPT